MKFTAALLAAACAVAAAANIAIAQDGETEKAIEKYRQMLKEDPLSNPGLLDADRGEALWTTPRGPKNVSLQQCDLGKGPGKVDGAFAELPRYFADEDRVMDAETRILWCMEKLQGFNRVDLVKKPHPGGGQPVKELGAIATYVASKSSGQARSPQRKGRGGARRNAVLPPLGSVRFRLCDLPRRQGPAHPAAGLAASVEPRGSAQGGRGMAGVPRVDDSRHDHAAPAVRLLLADADAGARARLGRQRGPHQLPGESGERRRHRCSRAQALGGGESHADHLYRRLHHCA